MSAFRSPYALQQPPDRPSKFWVGRASNGRRTAGSHLPILKFSFASSIVDRPDPIEAIQFCMEQRGLTRKDLEPLLGTRTGVSLGSLPRVSQHAAATGQEYALAVALNSTIKTTPRRWMRKVGPARGPPADSPTGAGQSWEGQMNLFALTPVRAY